MIKSELQSKGVYKSQFIRCWWRTLSKYGSRHSFGLRFEWYFEIFMIFFFFTTVIPVYPMNKHECGRSESLRGRQKFGTNRKKCSTNVKHRHVGINRRLIVQFNSNPRVQRLQTIVQVVEERQQHFWTCAFYLCVTLCTFARDLRPICPPSLQRVLRNATRMSKKKWFYEHNNNSTPASLFSNFFVVHAQLRHRITKYDSVAIGYVTWTRIFFKPHTFFPQIHLPSTRNK